MSDTTYTTNTTTGGHFEELAMRESDGIQVSLLWCRDDDSLKVVVVDFAAETAFELEVGSAPPLDVFNHPYAYQAFCVSAFDTSPHCLEAVVG